VFIVTSLAQQSTMSNRGTHKHMAVDACSGEDGWVGQQAGLWQMHGPSLLPTLNRIGAVKECITRQWYRSQCGCVRAYALVT